MPDVRGEDDRTGLLGEYEPVTRSYVDFLVATAAGRGVEEGLVALWAMEKVGGKEFSVTTDQRVT